MNANGMNRKEDVIESINSFTEGQLAAWPLAKRNFDALRDVRRRRIMVNGYPIEMQCNPARIVSTAAKTGKDDIAARKCFLCRSTRPAEQTGWDILPGWEMLINPYPILPVHLTVVSTDHRPQDRVPDDIVTLAEMLPGMAVFFNGARGGASAPDHLHMQVVLKDELPLLRLVERLHPSSEPGLKSSAAIAPRFPYLFLSGVVPPGDAGLPVLAAGLNAGGPAPDGSLSDPELVNTFFWLDDGGTMRFIVVPRKCHRPECYFAEGDAHRMISPGCIDMVGILILPRVVDFERLTPEEVSRIFSDVAVVP